MDFEKILHAVQSGKFAKIVNDESRTDYQKAADIAALDYAPTERKAPKPRKIKPTPAPGDANGNGEGLI